jgi:predicted nucleic acid-binding Zn ribbon protein
MDRRDKDPAHSADIIARLVETTKLGQNLEHAIVWQRWPDVVGRVMAAHCRPVWIRDGILRVEADSAVSMHKLSYRQWDIVKRVNLLTGKEMIRDIFLVLADDAGEPPMVDKKPSH